MADIPTRKEAFVMLLLLIGSIIAIWVGSTVLSLPKAIGYERATVVNHGFIARDTYAENFMIVRLQDGNTARFKTTHTPAAPIGEDICVHLSTRWVGHRPAVRLAHERYCATPTTD
ncbi:hypothetical protein [Actibacterium lipolyticum]|uniref:hypothetical protein n=1 Tax=Actibacterium lipolyticum TaxID=1524263 RepID=UPI000BB453E6|nr:hypothetical protein [Actibacterium lipolyticum]